LEVYLISDPTAKTSAAALDVKFGCLEDPKNYQGLAHFIEHTLFNQNKKYPKLSELDNYLPAHQGDSNASTMLEHTNYYFYVNHDALEGALDRFAHMFIDPIFNPQNIQRVLKSINSEYQKNMQSEWSRTQEALKALYKKDHPRKAFCIGNKDSLKNINMEVVSEKFKKYYSANNMKLAIISRVPIVQLEKWVEDKFSLIPNYNRPSISHDHDYIVKSKLPQLIKVKSLKDIKTLELVFQVPDSDKYWQAKPHEILTFLIGHEGKGSLLSLLKKKNLATYLYAYNHTIDYHGELKFSLKITKHGLKNIKQIIELFFSYINMIKKEGYKKYVYHENRKMNQLYLKYKELKEGTDLVSYYAQLMHQHRPLKIESNTFLIHKYSKEDFDLYISRLTPNNMRAILSTPSVKTNKTTQYYNTKYSAQSWSKSQAKKWQRVKIHPELHYPEPNKFIPKDLSLLKTDKRDQPYALIKDHRGIFWFQQDHHYQLPKAKVYLKLFSNKISRSAKNTLLTILYTQAISESLNEWKYPITMAGLRYDISSDSEGIILSFNGYSEHIPMLMTEVISRLKDITINKKIFKAITSKLKRKIANQDFDHAYVQSYRMANHIFYDPSFLPKSYRNLIPKIKLSQVKNFINQLYKEVAFEGLAYGNLEAETIKKVVDRVIDSLGAKVLPAARIKKHRSIKLKAKDKMAYSFQTKSNNNSWLKFIQVGNRSKKLNAIIRLITTHLDPLFMKELRFRQQLGYIIWMDKFYQEKALGVLAIVESERFSSLELSKRITTWHQGEGQKLMEQITDQQLATYKKAMITQFKQKKAKMSDHFMELKFQAFIMNGEFDFYGKLIEATNSVTKKDLINTYKHAYLNSPYLSIYFSKTGQKLVRPRNETLISDIKKFKNAHEKY